jgi:hypothetical protein
MKPLLWLLTAAPLAAQVAVSIDAAAVREPMEIGRYALGQGGLSDQPMFDSHVDAIRALRVKLIRLFVQEYFDVYPRRGVYNFATLDRAVKTIRETGAAPLMAICVKPRALYPEIDQDKTDPRSWTEWEELIFRMVNRYPSVRYWEVFNEPDIGEDGGCPGRFTAVAYARYYEHTARAIRRANPAARVGGPALASWRSPLLKGLLDHCAAGRAPLDFVSWHVYNSDPAAIRGTIESVKQVLAGYPALKCETVLDEWNMSLSKPRLEPGYQPAFLIDTIHQMREAGLDWAAYYHIRDWHVSQPQFAKFMSRKGLLNMVNWWNLTPQFDGLFDFQGVMRPAYFAFKMLGRLQGNRVEARADQPGVKAMAAWDPDQQMLHAVLWNFAVEAPPAREVRLTLQNLGAGKWTVRRFLLDAETSSNQENDRMRLRQAEDIPGGEFSASFTLPPYGVALISARRL